MSNLFRVGFYRCNLWITNSGRAEFSELPDNKLQSRRVCADHFKSIAFTNCDRKKLIKTHPEAVPQPWFVHFFQICTTAN